MPAIAVCQAPHELIDPSLSRASPLPHVGLHKVQVNRHKKAPTRKSRGFLWVRYNGLAVEHIIHALQRVVLRIRQGGHAGLDGSLGHGIGDQALIHWFRDDVLDSVWERACPRLRCARRHMS